MFNPVAAFMTIHRSYPYFVVKQNDKFPSIDNGALFTYFTINDGRILIAGFNFITTPPKKVIMVL